MIRSFSSGGELFTGKGKPHPVHPGEVLLGEFLKPMGLSQNRLALDIGVPPRRINEIVLGKRRISAETALRLARYFGSTPQFWLGLQADHDLDVAAEQMGDLARPSREKTMSKMESLQKYLHERIPISKAMGVEVVEATINGVVLSAPLLPNINHKKTVFGGSASAVAMLSSWALIYIRLNNENINNQIVIHKSTMTFERPIVDIFTASSIPCAPSVWLKFINTLKQKNRARIKLFSTLHCKGIKVGELEGDFVVLDSKTA